MTVKLENQWARVRAGYFDTAAFSAEAIRDTAAHNSSWLDVRGNRVLGVMVDNDLNHTAVVKAQGAWDIDGNGVMDVSGLSANAAPSGTAYILVSSIAYFPFVRVNIECNTAPTTGSISAHILGAY